VVGRADSPSGSVPAPPARPEELRAAEQHPMEVPNAGGPRLRGGCDPFLRVPACRPGFAQANLQWVSVGAELCACGGTVHRRDLTDVWFGGS